jgi:hypothetical protein
VFDIVEKSSKFLLPIITLVSSANKMGCGKYLLMEVGHLYILRKAKALKLTPLEFHILLFPILRKISQKVLLIFYCFLFVR